MLIGLVIHAAKLKLRPTFRGKLYAFVYFVHTSVCTEHDIVVKYQYMAVPSVCWTL
jgi:hypothetical protein